MVRSVMACSAQQDLTAVMLMQCITEYQNAEGTGTCVADQEKVKRLAESIAEIGLQEPVSMAYTTLH